MKLSGIDRYLWVCIVVVLVHVAVGIWASAIYSRPVGQDYRWHMGLTRAIVQRGLSAVTDEEFVSVGEMPYPPLYHLFFVLPVYLGCQDLVGRFLQVALFPVLLSVLILIAYRFGGSSEYAMYVALFLSAGHGFFDRGFQVAPQGFEMLFLAVAVWAYLGNRIVLFGVAALGMVYMHAPVAWILLFSFFVLILGLRSRDWGDAALFTYPVFLGSVPLVLFLAPYALSAALKHSQVLSAQKGALYAHPLTFVVVYLGPLFVVSIPFLVRLKWSLMPDLQRLMSLLALSLLALIPLWADRVPTYAVIPLSFLIPFGMGGARRTWLPVVVGFAAVGILLKFIIVPVMDA